MRSDEIISNYDQGQEIFRRKSVSILIEDLSRLEEQNRAVMRVIEKFFHPAGSPPPGGIDIWVHWALETKQKEIEHLQTFYDIVYKFVYKQKITCSETIWQCDWVIKNAYTFIDELYKAIKPDLPKEDWDNDEE